VHTGAVDVDAFIADGFVAVRGAVAPDTVRACVAIVEDQLRAQGVDPRDPATWSKPVVRLNCPGGLEFAAAGMSPALWQTYDALLGPDRWVRRKGVGGTLPIRFPSTTDPGDAGWHIDGAYDVGGQWWVNVNSRYRGLLALFLFTDVTDDDAPTEIVAGSHLDVPAVLEPHGETGVFFAEATGKLPASTWQRPRVRATGRAGDVFVCHPFLVHRATWPHRGVAPRIIAQPEIAHEPPFELDGKGDVCAVERAILRGLGRER
jgi:hypothetical protein